MEGISPGQDVSRGPSVGHGGLSVLGRLLTSAHSTGDLGQRARRGLKVLHFSYIFHAFHALFHAL